jgi:hypothetical protein
LRFGVVGQRHEILLIAMNVVPLDGGSPEPEMQNEKCKS